MSDDPTPDTSEQIPRDGAEEDSARPGREPVQDRPGGPGQAGMRVVGPGQVAPGAPGADEAPEEDQSTKDRREHLRAKSEDGA